MAANVHQDVERVLFAEEDLSRRVREMGAQISADYVGKDLLVVSILRGAAIFAADLVRAIELPLEMDFMAVSSYGNDTKSSGVVRFLKDVTSCVEGRHVLIVEDVLDSGLTLSSVAESFAARNAASVEMAVLLRKTLRIKRMLRAGTLASNALTSSLWATGLTTPNGTGTSRSSGS